jgi:tetratricopeptide (TPR) repeat protein
MAHARTDDLEALWARLPQPELGQAVRLLRQACGDAQGHDLPRDALAGRLSAASQRWVGIDGTAVWRWESGRHTARPIYRRLLAQVCEAELELMHPVTRRELLRQLAALAGVTVAGLDSEPWERLQHALQRPGGADVKTVDHLERMTVALLHSYRDASSPSIRPGAVRGQAVGHLETLSTLLDRPLVPQLRQRLCGLAGETSALLGWLYWNLDDLDGAGAYFRTGLQAAQEAEDAALGAYLVGSLACRPFYRENPSERLRLLEGRSFGFSGAQASPNTQAWLANLEAGGHALRRDLAGFEAASDRAAELLSLPDLEEAGRRPRLEFFDRAYFAEEQAACFLRLGQPGRASQVLEAALPHAEGRIRLWMLVDLASAHADEGQPEQAVGAAEEALAGAWDAGLQPVLHCVRDLLSELRPYRQLPAVQQLAERLRRLPPL